MPIPKHSKKPRSETKPAIIKAADVLPARVYLIYGRQGAGKTSLAATAPKCLILDTEEGTASIRRSGADVALVRKFEEMDPLYWYLRDSPHPYKAVAIDTLTRLLSHALRYSMGIDDTTAIDEVVFPSKRDWGTATELLKSVISQFRSLPMTVILTAHERAYEGDEETTMVGPVINPGVRGVLLGAVDITGRLYVKEVVDEKTKRKAFERRLLTGEHEYYEAKDRSAALPRIIRNPDMAKIIQRVEQGA